MELGKAGKPKTWPKSPSTKVRLPLFHASLTLCIRLKTCLLLRLEIAQGSENGFFGKHGHMFVPPTPFTLSAHVAHAALHVMVQHTCSEREDGERTRLVTRLNSHALSPTQQIIKVFADFHQHHTVAEQAETAEAKFHARTSHLTPPQ